MHQENLSGLRFCAIALCATTAAFGLVASANAQITPDDTLGEERSRVTPGVEVRGGAADLIDGGASRGSNLFHSFSEFNVNDGQRVYFANPIGIENILGRVTGSDISDIMGTLGVDGAANLFLLNPNGFVFGPNAQLDIRGSFLATTADGFSFANGTQFSATDPQAPPLLTMSVPIGLQYGSGTPQPLTSEANLTVGRDLVFSAGSVTSNGTLSAPTGQIGLEAVTGDLRVRNLTAQEATLAAVNNIVLEESQLRTTGDLRLAAGNTVFVRDSVANPFLTLVGGDLYLRGEQGIDILALNHPETPFQVAGDLTLVSDGNVSGDAHYYTGGNFSILTLSGDPGTFVSLYDPIISAQGDVSFGTYTGAALKVEARGSIDVTGDVTITGPDTALDSPTSNGLGEAVVVALDGTFQSAQLGTAGQAVSAAQLNTFLGLPLGGDAFEGSVARTTFTAQNGDALQLGWNFLTNEDINSPFNDYSFVILSGPGITGDGYSLLADTSTPGLTTSAEVGFANETGQRSFTSSSLLSTGLSSGSYTVSLGVVDAGDGVADSQLRILNASLVNSNPQIGTRPLQIDFGDPDISILLNNPALILRAGVSTLLNAPSTLPRGEGGATFAEPNVPLPSPANISVTGNIDTSGVTTAPNGGPVIMSAPGNITISNAIINTSGNGAGNGNGGNISLNAGDDNPSNGLGGIQLNGSSFSTGTDGDGNAGSVRLIAEGLISLRAGDINTTVGSFSSPGNGSAGAVFIESRGLSGGQAIEFVDTSIDVASFVNNGRTGSVTILAPNGGDISLEGRDFRPTIFTDTYAIDERLVGQTTGGDIRIEGGDLTISNYTFNSEVRGRGNGGGIVLSGNGTVSISGGSNIFTDVRVPNVQVPDDSTPDPTDSTGVAPGIGGNISISGNAISITGNGTRISTDTRSSNATEAGGRIELNARNTNVNNIGILVSDRAFISAETSGQATGGSINLNAGVGIIRFDDGTASVQTSGAGNGGELTLTAGTIELRNGARIQAQTEDTGAAGDVTLTATQRVSLSGSSNEIAENTRGLFSGIETSSINSNSGRGGDISINVRNEAGTGLLELNGRSYLNASTNSTNPGGDITLRVDELSIQGGSQVLTLATGTGPSSGSAGLIQVDATRSVMINGSGIRNATIEPDAFAEVTLLPLVGTDRPVAGEQALVTNNPFYANPSRRSTGQPPGFDYYAFSITTPGSRGIFDIDTATFDPATTFDTVLDLFNQNTGALLASNDNSDPSLGEGGSSSSLDSYIEYTFDARGRYVIGVGQFDLDGNLAAGDYNLRISLENQGPVTFDAETLNPNNGLNSGLFAETRSSGAIGNVQISTPSLTVSNGARISTTATAQATNSC